MHPKERALVLCPLPTIEGYRDSRAERERRAREYWDRLSQRQEAWVLRRMKFASMGEQP